MSALDVADRLMEALGRFDAAALGAVLAPDARHWLNISGNEQGRDALLAQIELEGSHISESVFEVRHRVATTEGFVLQLTVRGETTGGASFSIPTCLVVAIDGDAITRIDEYANATDAAPLIAELFPSG